jgi:hypothetical protein
MAGAELTTKIVLLANSVLTAQRALVAMKAAVDRRAHGFSPVWLFGIRDEDQHFAELLTTIPMDPASGTIQARGVPPPVGGKDPEPYSFTLDVIDQQPNDPRRDKGCTEVLVKVVTTNPKSARRNREIMEWLATVTGKNPPRTGLWIVVGQDEAIGSEGADRSNLFLHKDLQDLVEALLIGAGNRLATVVISVGGFEYYLLDAYREDTDGRIQRPLERACDPAFVERVLAALLRQASLLGGLVKRCSAWQAAGARLGRSRLALVQPMSSNGFFSDDGAPNVDRASGSPLVTPDGMVEDYPPGARKSPFPRTDRERPASGARPGGQPADTALPFWLPYLTADAPIAIALHDTERQQSARERSLLAVECRRLDAELPKTGLPDLAIEY